MFMLELRLVKATLLKNVLSSKANFDFSGTGVEVQAMDTRRVALFLRADAFNHYCCNCDRDLLSLGLNLSAMAKAFRFANDDDIVTIKAQEGWSDITFTFQSPGEDGEITDFDFDFDFVHIKGVPREIPESDYQAIVRMPSTKFMHMCNLFHLLP